MLLAAAPNFKEEKKWRIINWDNQYHSTKRVGGKRDTASQASAISHPLKEAK